MATKPKLKARYFKLGLKAHVFYDPTTQLKVTKEPGKLETSSSKKIVEALANGHIVEIEVDEYNKLVDVSKQSIGEADSEVEDLDQNEEDPEKEEDTKEVSKDGTKAFGKMNKDELLVYLDETYDLTDADKEKYAAMTVKDLRKEVTELEK